MKLKNLHTQSIRPGYCPEYTTFLRWEEKQIKLSDSKSKIYVIPTRLDWMRILYLLPDIQKIKEKEAKMYICDNARLRTSGGQQSKKYRYLN